MTTNKIKELQEIMFQTYDVENFSRCFEIACEILEVDSKNSFALNYKALSTIKQSNIHGKSRIGEAIIYFKNRINVFEDNYNAGIEDKGNIISDLTDIAYEINNYTSWKLMSIESLDGLNDYQALSFLKGRFIQLKDIISAQEYIINIAEKYSEDLEFIIYQKQNLLYYIYNICDILPQFIPNPHHVEFVGISYSEKSNYLKRFDELISLGVVDNDEINKKYLIISKSVIDDIDRRNIIDAIKTESSKYSKPQPQQGGCYIATAVYGSYEAAEVMILRQYRDEVLAKNIFGRAFIKTYYFLSPPVADRLKNAKKINKLVKGILDKWVANLQKL